VAHRSALYRCGKDRADYHQFLSDLRGSKPLVIWWHTARRFTSGIYTKAKPDMNNNEKRAYEINRKPLLFAW